MNILRYSHGRFRATLTHTILAFAVLSLISGCGGEGDLGGASPSVGIGDVAVTEGDSGTVMAEFTVTLSSAISESVTVDYETADGTATTADDDYTAASGTLTFDPGTTSQVISVLVHGDTDEEPDENFTVTLSSSGNVVLPDVDAVGTILNDDIALVVPAISINDVSVTEGGSGEVTADFTVTLSGVTTETVTVDYTTADDTATTANGDYTATSGTLTFDPGSTSQVISVAVHGDTAVELDESFTVTLSNPGNATLEDAAAVGTILNDDIAPLVPAIGIGDVSITEGDSGTVTADFTVTLSSATSNTVTVDYATADDTATTADSDYTAASGTLTFSPGSTSQVISVTVQGDTAVEPNESFIVALSNPGNAILEDATAVGVILNDDVAVVPAISIGDASVTEGDGGTVTAAFTLTLSSPTSNTVTVDYATADNTATTANGDYTAASGTLTIGPGNTSRVVRITVHGDTDEEPDENFIVTLSNPGNATLDDADAVGVILNDDVPVVPEIDISDVSITEGDSGTVTADFTVTLSSATTTAVTVDYATADGTATTGNSDYTAASGTLTFDPGSTSRTISVTVHGDAVEEPDENFTVTLSNPGNATLDNASAAGTILNDDEAVVPVISIGDVSVTEGDSGTVTADFTVTLSSATTTAVTVDYATADGSATTANSDYTAASGTLTFNPDSTSQTISITVHGDAVEESDENFTVTLSDPGNATLDNANAVGTILNDDVAVVPAISIGDVSITEGDSGTVNADFTVTLSSATTTTVTVDYATADDTATIADSDYAAASGTLVFNPDSTSQVISVPVFGDPDEELDESFTVTLSNPGNATLDDASAVGIILNNDVAVVPAISISDVSITEGDSGTVNADFTVTLSSATTNTVTVDYATADGSATTANSDYTAASGTLTFNPDSTSQTISITVHGDALEEPDESFTVTLSNPGNATLDDASAIGAILNDDEAVVPAISIGDVSITEGDSGTVTADFTVTLSSATTTAVTVDYATADGSATTANSDYTAASGTLTFDPGSISQTISITVHGDTAEEPDESFTVTLSNPGNATLDDASAVGTILNDDVAVVPAISIGDVSVTEGDSGTVIADFTVTLSSATTNTVTVDYATADDTATIADIDYTASSGTLTFDPGSTSQTISVTVHGDAVEEPDESFVVTLSNPGNATLADASAVGAILNDDVAVVPAISIGDASITEGDSGTITADFPVTLSSATTNTVTVDYATADDIATIADGDYTAASGTLTFSPGSTSQSISVTVHGDADEEPDESFIVTLSNPGNATLSDGEAMGTITNDDDPQPGLEARPSNTTCVAPDRPQTSTDIELESVFSNLSVVFPLALLQAPGDNSRWFVVEKGGRILSFPNDPDVAEGDVEVFVDISANVDSLPNEAGLLGMAFDPDFDTNGYVYLSYTAPGLTSHISRFSSPDNGRTLDAASEQVMLAIPQPKNNHNGGNIAFGPGPSSGKYLYIGLGDGGDGGHHARKTETLLGTMLRIDVDVSETDWDNGIRYHIPADNPFAANAKCPTGTGSTDCPEIYAWGLRNPWRWSFDRDTGDLWLGDVGQNLWEEINYIENGGDYGWNIREGAHCFNAETCDTSGLIDPVVEYDHSLGASVTGGYVYRGSSIIGLQGTYIYGDFISGRIWGLDAAEADPNPKELLASGQNIASFAEGNDGELYVLDFFGDLFRITAADSGDTGDSFPNVLSATGCVETSNPAQPGAGLIPYDINAPFWSDGVDKQRYLSIPDGATIHMDSGNDWDFPIGSVLLKNFSINGDLIETRLLMRHPDGDWGGYSYEWNDAQTDATLVLGGKTKVIDGQTWLYPSTSQCSECHTQAGGGPLGPETAQMNRDFTFPSTARIANQLHTYEHIGMFDMPLPDTPANLPALADPEDSSADLHARARAYLHTNCAQCHQPGGPTPVDMNLLYTTADADMNICDIIPQNGDLGIDDARLIDPGDPDRSILVQRMKRRDVYGMPPLGSFLVDADGAALLEAWITAMGDSCP